MAKRSGVAPSLTREQIAATALALADTEEVGGLGNVSVRRVAAELGRAPMALYTYFDSIQEIHAAAVALAFREVDAVEVPGERWDATLRRTMGSIRQMYLHHANANLVTVEMGGYGDALAEHTARIYGLYTRQGVPAPILRNLWCVVDAFLGGFVPAELFELREHPVKPDPQGRVWMETAESAYNEDTFNSGIDIIVAGVRALAAPDPCDWRSPQP